jgi:putative nucleotidyltransferase with HDIG domain
VSRVFLVFFIFFLGTTLHVRPVPRDRYLIHEVLLSAQRCVQQEVIDFCAEKFSAKLTPRFFYAEKILARANADIFLYAVELSREVRMPKREDAWKLLCEYTSSESLRKHMLAVEACVRAYARKFGADEDLWGITALVHDFDYERWPNNDHAGDKEHPAAGAKILRELGYPDEMVRAILSHADYTNVPRESQLEHTLFACDELAGFLTACSYVRPSKSILDLEVDSVKRRLKDKAFAKGINREDVRKGAEELGVPLEEHVQFCIAALRENADALGLRGSL